MNLTGNCFIKADVLNGTLFNDILYLSRCVRVGKGEGGRGTSRVSDGRWNRTSAPVSCLEPPGAADVDPA